MSAGANLQFKMYILNLVGSLPWLLVMLAGGVVCLLRFSTRPREGWLVGAAIALALFSTFGVSNAISWIIEYFPGLLASLATGTESHHRKFQLLYGVPSSIVQAASWGLSLFAAFGQGSGPSSKYLVEDDRSERNSPR